MLYHISYSMLTALLGTNGLLFNTKYCLCLHDTNIVPITYKRICSTHLKEEMFASWSKAKATLKMTAIPTLFNVPNPPARIGVKRRLVERKGMPEVTNTTSKYF